MSTKGAVLIRYNIDNTAPDGVKQFGQYLLKLVTKMRYLGTYAERAD